MRVGVFHPGSQNSWQRALAFQEADALAWYATSLHFPADGAAMRAAAAMPGAAGRRLRRLLGRRCFPPLGAANLRRMGALEPLEVMLRRFGLAGLAARLDPIGNRRFGHLVTRLAAREPVDAIWTHNGCALEAFRWARARGIARVLDQSVGHPRAMNAVLAAERARAPAHASVADRPYSEAWIARADAEVALADRVVVGSDFARETMLAHGCPAAKLRVLPYGYDETLFPDTPPARPPLAGRPLEVLFVGSVQARKGVAHLLEAMARLPASSARLTLIGRLDLPAAAFAPHAARVRHLPQVPRAEVAAHMRAADVLVLPSLFEGGGVVLYEALAAGLAIVQSRACGDGVVAGSDGLGANGIVLERVDAAAIAAAIRACASDPERLARWQAASWDRRSARTWAVYRAGARALLAELAA